ncbi:hypothetical protein Tco_1286400 [Tanacetum coccineum]
MGDADINTLPMEQYLALTRGNQTPGVVKLEIEGNFNFKIKSQFMRELREDTFSRNKNDDAYEHVGRILDIVRLFNISEVTHDAVMPRVFPIALTRATKRWVDRLSLRAINPWDLLKNAFIQMYCRPSKMAKKLEDIHTFKHEDSQGPIPNKTPAQALTAIQPLADHSQKWYDGSTSRKTSNDSLAEIAAITNKLDSLGRDMKKLKKNVHVIQVGCENYGGAHLNKECRLHKEVKGIEEVKMDNQPPLEERRSSLTDILTKYIEDSAKKEAEHDEWLRKFQETTEMNQKGHDEIIRRITTLYTIYFPNEIEYFSANSSLLDEEVQDEMEEDKEINDEAAQQQHVEEALIHKAMESLKGIKINRPLLKEIRQTDDYAKHIKNLVENKSRISEDEDVKMNTSCSAILHNQLPPKKQDPGSFTLFCSIGKLTFNALADLGASKASCLFRCSKG